MALIDEAKETLADLISFPTVSADSNLELITYAAERLTDAGATLSIMRDEEGRKANLFATLGPEIDGGIVLSGHTDVVPADGEWTSDPFAMREADGLIYGRGACDMKGFLAAALAMAPHYAKADLKRPIHFALTYDEEVGCLGARQLVEELRQMTVKPSAVIIGEPTGMGIIEGHKGCYEYTTEFTGLEGHGSQPDLGVNAVEYAVRYIARLMELGESMK
ncbi:MAG: M20/M25/M40 family metallo-hydrolase, partial [Salaquimonas sp.]|nr:M20/M25/M40 family metallo-hydrolase [Salaquimonas sp.]